MTGTPKIAGAIARTAGDRAAPPISRTLDTGTPLSRRHPSASANEHSTASTAARAMFGGVAFPLVSPRSTPVAAGRFGVRSPSR